MAASARFSPPVSLPTPTLKRFPVPPSSPLFLSGNFVARLGFLRLNYRQRTFAGIRSMSTGESEASAVPSSVPVPVAYELLQAGHRYLDVRTVDEFNAGHVVGATNIPYMFKVGSGMIKNPTFLDEVSKTFGKDDELLIGCQSGKRSLMAATELLSAGFSGLIDVAGGYSAWVQNNLPTEQ